ncbi:hypothetical protein CJS96_16980 [Salmonella enterica]|nr:hypothetical protein [Salmonella enterica]EBT2935561.1 hypothetical protein [Salmonella enterica]EBT2976326.1 hypothetical protein [Salmonella enterica]
MGSCAAPSAKGDDKFITTDYLQQCLLICVFVAFGRETRGVVISGTDSDALPESAISHRT